MADVLQPDRPGGIGADVVVQNLVASSAPNIYFDKRARDDVAIVRAQAADGVVRAAVESTSERVRGQRCRAGRIEADQVAGDDVGRAGQVEALYGLPAITLPGAVPGEGLPWPSSVAPPMNSEVPLAHDPVSGVADGRHAGQVGADVVALHDVAGRPRRDHDAVSRCR